MLTRCWSWDSGANSGDGGWKKDADSTCSCKQPKMEPANFDELRRRIPVVPHPEPSRAKSDEWAPYGELVAKGKTLDVYRPSAGVSALSWFNLCLSVGLLQLLTRREGSKRASMQVLHEHSTAAQTAANLDSFIAAAN